MKIKITLYINGKHSVVEVKEGNSLKNILKNMNPSYLEKYAGAWRNDRFYFS